MNKLIDWIKQRHIVAFYAIVFAISWGLWIPFAGALARGADLLFPLLVFATCGPRSGGDHRHWGGNGRERFGWCA